MPFLGVQGFMVTKFADRARRRARSRRTSSRNYMSTPAAQAALAAANGRFPANTAAGKRVNDPVLTQFGTRQQGRRADAEHPADGPVWADLGGAWVKSTKGSGARQGQGLFDRGARNIANKIG